MVNHGICGKDYRRLSQIRTNGGSLDRSSAGRLPEIIAERGRGDLNLPS